MNHPNKSSNENNKLIDRTKKIQQLILKYGIPQYLKKWDSSYPKKFETSQQNINFLMQFVKKYHPHSMIWLTVWTKEIPMLQTDIIRYEDQPNPMPIFKWDNNNKIGTISIFQFTDNKNKNKKDKQKIIRSIRTIIKRWVKKDIKGLIIDLRKHFGGNMWPAITSLTDIFGRTTLLAFTNKTVNKFDNVWLTIDNLTYNNKQKFLTANLNFTKPITIIVSNKTASSGEFVASCFYGRMNTKIFGHR